MVRELPGDRGHATLVLAVGALLLLCPPPFFLSFRIRKPPLIVVQPALFSRDLRLDVCYLLLATYGIRLVPLDLAQLGPHRRLAGRSACRLGR
jgi:hypothetical protein